MNLEALRARAAELRALIESLTEQRGALVDAAVAEKRGMTADEQGKYDALAEQRSAAERELPTVEARISEVEAQEKRNAAAAELRAKTAPAGPARVTSEPEVYRKNDPSTSYFRDLFMAQHRGDPAAAERLRRNGRMVAEQRALSTTAGAGGEFAPPQWLVSDFVKLARPGRKFADSLGPEALPGGVASVNIPKVTGGTSTAIQATNNATLSQTDMTTSSVSSGISTIGGKQVVSLQLLEQSGIPFDNVVLMDLAADYAKQFDNQVINGSGSSGQLNGVYTYFAASGTVNTTYTQATPAVGGAGGFYAKVFAACAAIEAARYVAADTIWMHPRRWNWVLSSSDSNNRPLVTPVAGSGHNVIGASDYPLLPEGAVGMLGGLAVITDANIVTNTGAGTNQDPVLVGVRNDLRLWESDLRMETFTATYADSAGVLFRALAFSAAIPSRYTTSVSVINGTGLVAPTF